MERIYKTLSADVSSIPDSRQIKFTISTGAVDRDGDILDPKGWELKHYQKSPVVLWSHDYSQMPIAKAIGVVATDKGLDAVAEFPPKGVYPFADQVYDMLKGGFLSATSVGFRPLEHEPIKGGRNYKKQELLEFSVVPVPANPEALMQRGIDAEQASQWKAVVKGWAEAPVAPWDRYVSTLNEKFADCDTWQHDSEAKQKFLADLRIETEDGTKAMGEARLHKLLALNGLVALAQKYPAGIPDNGSTNTVAEVVHAEAMGALKHIRVIQSLIESVGVGQKDMTDAHKEKLNQAHQAASYAEQHAMNAADCAHQLMMAKTVKAPAADDAAVLEITSSDEPVLEVAGDLVTVDEACIGRMGKGLAEAVIAQIDAAVGEHVAKAINRQKGRVD